MPGVCGGLTDILLGLPACIVCLCSGLHRVDTGFASGRLFLGWALYRFHFCNFIVLSSNRKRGILPLFLPLLLHRPI